MTPAGAKRAVLVASMVTGAVAIVRAAQRGEVPRLSIGVGVVLETAVLTALADQAPQLAAGLAGLTTFGAAVASPEALAAVADGLSVRRSITRQPKSAALAGDAVASMGAAAGSAVGAGGSWPAGYWRDHVPELVPIGQGGHKLQPGAAAALARAEELYGARIWVTDSYRPYDLQLAGWKRDPNRFASPDKSRHVRGLAIDVHTGKINVRDPRFLDAMRQAGWCQARPSDEPWHFSWGDCG